MKPRYNFTQMLTIITIGLLVGAILFTANNALQHKELSTTTAQAAISESPSVSSIPSEVPSVPWGYLVPCPSCSGPSVAPVVSGPAAITSTEQYPSPAVSISNPNPEDPCDTENASIAHDKKKKKGWKHSKHKNKKGALGEGMDAFIKLLLELINKIIDMLGGQPIKSPEEPQAPEVPNENNEETAPCPSINTPSLAPSPVTSVQPISAYPSLPVTSQTPSIGPSPVISGPISGSQANVKITFYGSYDNDPPGSKAIANPVKHQEAGGAGTFTDPLTFASPAGAGEYPYGTIIYVPRVQKYFVREDECAVSQTAPNGCGAVTMVDLYVGNPSDAAAVEACENSLTPSGNSLIYINPPGNLPVDPKPIWNQLTGECMTPH